MTAIALMRHFPTDWNVEQRLQGSRDIPLNDAARDALSGLHLPAPWCRARLISSNLSRAVETAERLAGDRSVGRDPRLAEVSFGEWEGRRAADLLADPAAGFRPTHEWEPETRAPGGESLTEAWGRISIALADIAADPAPAVIVTHKAVMRLILRHGGIAAPEIKRGRLYPLTLDARGMPKAPQAPMRLEAR